ncbi:hypothetical protein [Desulfuromonas sp. AOP6]|uniref:hypothetical protein n=1 Tax=Desulfuromonas sp. AOP6 TaxID=1566351 RepID=UPI001278B6AD|nr:hypothetical protein [Desulfuromonas sp. AOP6]BCA81005.1 hypothetical protein AOP6_2792 [Desulfuromonas sp. AOP6]
MTAEDRPKEQNERITTGFKISKVLAKRMENYLDSPNSGVKSKTELFSRALTEYLDLEEKIIDELEKEREKIKRRLRGL